MFQRTAFTCFFVTLLLTVLPRFASCASVAFAFDHDTGVNCDEYSSNECETNKEIFFHCPISCAQALEPTSQHSSSGRLDDEAFYQLKATDVNGKSIDFENYEGYITVIAALPKQAGVYIVDCVLCRSAKLVTIHRKHVSRFTHDSITAYIQ